MALATNLANSTEDPKRFCFESSVSLKEVQNNISYLLLPNDSIAPIPTEHCLDIYASANRLNLLELSLKKRYNLFHSTTSQQSRLGRVNNLCLVLIKMSYFPVNKVKAEALKSIDNELLLGVDKKGMIEVFDNSLELSCLKDARGRYEIEFKNLANQKQKRTQALWANEVVNLKELLLELEVADTKLNETIEIVLRIKEEK